MVVRAIKLDLFGSDYNNQEFKEQAEQPSNDWSFLMPHDLLCFSSNT
jgi:hypothetical protein